PTKPKYYVTIQMLSKNVGGIHYLFYQFAQRRVLMITVITRSTIRWTTTLRPIIIWKIIIALSVHMIGLPAITAALIIFYGPIRGQRWKMKLWKLSPRQKEQLLINAMEILT